MASSRRSSDREEKIASARKAAEATAGKGSKAFKLPSGVNRFMPKDNTTYKIAVVGFAAGKGNPTADEGYLACCRPYWCHGQVGANQDTFLCPAANYQKRCPNCELFQAELRRTSYEDAKQLKAKQRELWNILDWNDLNKGVQVFDCSHFGFGKLVLEKAGRKEKYQNFHSIKNGFDLEVTFKNEPIGKNPFIKAVDVEFIERAKPVGDLADKAVCFDKGCLVELPYDELKSILESGVGDADDDHGKAKDDDSQDSKDDSQDSAVNEAEEAGIARGDFVMYKKKKMEVVKVSNDGTSLTLNDSDDEAHRGVAPADCKLIEDSDASADDSQDSAPATKASRKPKQNDDDEPNALDHDEDDEGGSRDSSADSSADSDDSADAKADDDSQDSDKPAPKKKASKPAAKDEDSGSAWGDDDSADKPAPKKKPAGKPKR